MVTVTHGAGVANRHDRVITVQREAQHMGFYIMLFSAILGVILLVVGIRLSRKNKWFFALSALGVISMAIAVWLGLPK